jgi:ABC-type polysaccharide/polyol phosphate transport system ATPase subunit
MLRDGSIRVETLWKRFRADARRWQLRDHVQMIGRRRRVGRRGSRWALKDVNFEVHPGEAIGLVGMNGSGKSTLLKILARVMYPYAGRAEAAGRVGALIEVRSGIHPDLSGIENIFFYGSMLGLRRREIASRTNEIIEFAELADAAHRQVKFYSTGMQMRLGFAVAAFLEPHVLLVDEVLAVGDAPFQQRCLERMKDVLHSGTTLFYVSHDLPTVQAVCNRGIWLRDGAVAADGGLPDVLASYRSFIELTAERMHSPDGVVRVTSADVHGPLGDGGLTDHGLSVRLVVQSDAFLPTSIYLGVSEGTAAPIFVLRRETQLRRGETIVHCQIERLPLPAGQYFLWGGVGDRSEMLLGWHPLTRFSVMGPSRGGSPPGVVSLAPLHVTATWDIDASEVAGPGRAVK